MQNVLNLRKEYTLNEHNYQLKIPMNVDILIPDNDCVRLISHFVEEMDLTDIYETYERMPSEKYASPEIAEKVSRSEPTVHRHLNNLVSMNMLERIGSRKSGYWNVKI